MSLPWFLGTWWFLGDTKQIQPTLSLFEQITIIFNLKVTLKFALPFFFHELCYYFKNQFTSVCLWCCSQSLLINARDTGTFPKAALHILSVTWSDVLLSFWPIWQMFSLSCLWPHSCPYEISVHAKAIGTLEWLIIFFLPLKQTPSPFLIRRHANQMAVLLCALRSWWSKMMVGSQQIRTPPGTSECPAGY